MVRNHSKFSDGPIMFINEVLCFSKALDDYLPADIFSPRRAANLSDFFFFLLDMMSYLCGKRRNARLIDKSLIELNDNKGWMSLYKTATLKQGHRRQLNRFSSLEPHVKSRSGSVNIHRVLMYCTHLLTVNSCWRTKIKVRLLPHFLLTAIALYSVEPIYLFPSECHT